MPITVVFGCAFTQSFNSVRLLPIDVFSVSSIRIINCSPALSP